MRSLIDELKTFVEKAMGNSFDHGYPHVKRVMKHAYEIVLNEGLNVDRESLIIAVLLHDIGRLIGEPHAYYSSLIARSILLDKGFPNNKIDCIVNAILYHSYSYARERGIEPLCEEAKVLSDADKLDALGAVGFIRVFLYGERNGRSVEESIKHFHEKILNLHRLMHYSYSREKALVLRDRVLEMLKYIGSELSMDIREDG